MTPSIPEIAELLFERFEGEGSTDSVSDVARLLLELMCEYEQTDMGFCFAAAHKALLHAQMDHRMIPDTRTPPPPPPEPPPWNSNPNVVALNAKLVEVQQQLDVVTERWRELAERAARGRG